MTYFFVYDNDVRRYEPPPSVPDEDLIDTASIENVIKYLRKSDICDVYYDGSRRHMAHRFRAVPSINQYPSRNQEHFAYWILDSNNQQNIPKFSDVPNQLESLFESETWKYPEEESEEKNEVNVTSPQDIVNIWRDTLEEHNLYSEYLNSENIKRGADFLRQLEIDSKSTYTFGTSNYVQALKLLIELRDTNKTIVIGDFNKPNELDALDPDIIIKYNNRFSFLEELNKQTEKKALSAKENRRLNILKNSIDELHDHSDNYQEEICIIDDLLDTVRKSDRNHKPRKAAMHFDEENIPEPAQRILSEIQELHKTYDFRKQQNKLSKTLIPSSIYDYKSPFDEVAEHLLNRRDIIENKVYEKQLGEVIHIEDIDYHIEEISNQIKTEKGDVRDELAERIIQQVQDELFVGNKTLNQKGVEESPSLATWKLVVIGVIIFLIGAVLGAIIAIYIGIPIPFNAVI